AAIIVIFLLIVATRPSSFRIERKTTIAAPPASVFAKVNDLHNWQAWSPWEKMDPDLKRTYGGPSAGNGATYAWVGNKKVGEGRMTIIESRPNELTRINPEFLKTLAATYAAAFLFPPQRDH